VISLNLDAAVLTSADVREAYSVETCTTTADCTGDGDTCLPAKYQNGEDMTHTTDMHCCPPEDQMRDSITTTNGGYFGQYCELHTEANPRPAISNSFADECEVSQNIDLLPSEAKSDCHEPSATAYDHHEGDISNSITTVWKLFVKSDPKSMPVQEHTRYSNNPGEGDQHALTGIDQSQRGEYVITYDVVDSSGNRAEQVQFALIMLDSYAPTLQTSLQSCLSAWSSACSCPTWQKSGLEDTTVGSGTCTDGDSVSGSFHGCADTHTTKTTEFCGFQQLGDYCGANVNLTPDMSLTYEVGQGDYKCHGGVVDSSQLTNGRLNADANTHFSPLTNVIAYDKYDGNVDTTTVGGINNHDWKFNADFGASCAGSQLITPPTGEPMTIKTEDFADIFGKDNRNNEAEQQLHFAVQDTTPPQICSRSDGTDAGCQEDNIWRDFECGVSGILDEIDSKYPLFKKVNGGKSDQAWKPPYADCRDYYHFEKSTSGAYVDDNMFAQATSCSLSKLQEKVGIKSNYEACKATAPTTAVTFEEPLQVACTTNLDCSNGYSCLIDAQNNGKCFKRVQTGSGYLQYTATDCSGNDACPRDEEFFVVDTIPPTLYLTTTEIDTAWNHDMLCGGTGADGQASHWANGDGEQNGDWVGEFCTAYEDMMHKVASKNQAEVGVTHVSYHPGSVYTNAVLIQHSAGYASDYSFIEDLVTAGTGYLCFDLCSGAETEVTTTWSTESCGGAPGTFDMLKVGTYYLKYECKDQAGHATSACRTISNEDKTKPVVTIIAASNSNEGIWYVESSRDQDYADAGASCTDMVDGNISDEVEVSGDIVDLSKPGTYKLSYNCHDSSDQAADTGVRTVVVRDTTCPTCTLGATAELVNVEASFPYEEVPTSCTDTLDGALTSVQSVSRVDDTSYVSTVVDVEMTGTYKITYCAKDSEGNGPVQTIDGVETCTCTGACSSECKFRTVTVQDTIIPVISLHYNNKVLVQSGSGLMAETAGSVDGWVIGAVASAVSGVALLGYAVSRKTATEVPV